MLTALVPGATIGISAPAGPVKREKLERAVLRLHDSGYRTKLSANVFQSDGFLSSDDETRASELHRFFHDSDVDAVWAARGGVGTSRLLNRLDFETIVSSRKPFIGFSDLTAVQWALWAKHRYITFTGPLAVEFDDALSAATEQCAWDVLSGDAENVLEYFPKHKLDIVRGSVSQIIAPALPGNLTMIATLLGTPWMPDLRGVMLIIEDIAEPPYRVDRLLFHLRNAGCLQNLAALIVGDFGWDESDEAARAQLRRSVLDATSGTSYPVIFNFPYGHGRDRATLPVGAPLSLRLDHSPSLTIAVSPFISSSLV